MKDYSQIDKILGNQNLHEYKWIDPGEIIVAQWVRIKCMYGCSDYGGGVCPPNTPSVEDCAKFFKEYQRGLLIRLAIYGDKENYPSEWSSEKTNALLELERQVFLLGYQKAFLLNQTCCGKCKECTHNRIDCKDKRYARPSPERFAVDVYQTVRNAGWEIEVVSSNPSDFNRFAILLVE